MKQKISRAAFVEEVRSYLGTPYRHQGRVPHQGLDCIGVPLCALLRLGAVPQSQTTLCSDYPMRAEDDLLERLLQSEAAPVELHLAQPGDLVLFRWPEQHFAQHVGVISRALRRDWDCDISFIHAYNSDQNAFVIEHGLRAHWRDLHVATYRLHALT